MPTRNGSSRSLRSEVGPNTNEMSYKDFSAWRRAEEDKINAKFPEAGKERSDAFDQLYKIEDARNKAIRLKEKQAKEERKKEKNAVKEAKAKEFNRVEGLSKALVYEMEPYEIALSQRIYDDEKDEQKSYETRTAKTNGVLMNDVDEDGKPRGFGVPEYYKDGIKTGDKKYTILAPVDPLGTMKKWLKVDEEASKRLAEDLKAKGENVFYYPYNSQSYLLKTIKSRELVKKEGTNQYEYQTVDKPVAVLIGVYKNAPHLTDTQLAANADVRAKQIVTNYAAKLINKTESIAGKGAELKDTPKITLRGHNPWQESTVEIAMGDKRVTWKTKMIWNRSVNDKSFNQWPTRLQSTVPA